MSLLDDLRKKLDSETFTKVTDALGDDFNYDLVPRSRLNKVIAQRNEARSELVTLKQGDTDPESIDDPDDGVVELPKGSAQQQKPPKGKSLTQQDLDAAVAAARSEGDAKVKELQLKYAATAKLREAKFTDPDLVLAAGLIDFSKVEMDDKGVITKGLDDQITAVAAAKPYLVGASTGAPTGTGKAGGGVDFGSITSRDDFLKLPSDKQIEFKNSNPEAFKGFMQEFVF